jgi:hypothetical protein
MNSPQRYGATVLLPVALRVMSEMDWGSEEVSNSLLPSCFSNSFPFFFLLLSVSVGWC